MLPIVKSLVKNGDISLEATTLINSGSELNFMNSKLCKSLGLGGVPVKVNIIGVGGEVLRKVVKKVDVVIEDRTGCQTWIEYIVLDNPCGKAVPNDSEIIDILSTEINKCKSELFSTGSEIDILIGMAIPQLHQQLSFHVHSSGLAVIGTKFGPCIVGPVSKPRQGNYESGNFNSNQISVLHEDINMKQFLETEIAGVTADSVPPRIWSPRTKYAKQIWSPFADLPPPPPPGLNTLSRFGPPSRIGKIIF